MRDIEVQIFGYGGSQQPDGLIVEAIENDRGGAQTYDQPLIAGEFPAIDGDIDIGRDSFVSHVDPLCSGGRYYTTIRARVDAAGVSFRGAPLPRPVAAARGFPRVRSAWDSSRD